MAFSDYHTVRKLFVDGGLPVDLTEALLDEYIENKRRYFLGDYAPSAVSGGRFCEAVVRVLQFLGKDPHIPLDAAVHVERALARLENDTTLGDGLRLFVPRAVRLIYGVRNTRNTAHLNGGIDPSLQDATLVVGTLDWILAELVRTVHGVETVFAQNLIESIVSKEVPIIAVYNGKPVILTELSHIDQLLVVLYWANMNSATTSDLRSWLPSNVAKNLSRLLKAAAKERYVHVDKHEVFLTPLGRRRVEQEGLLGPT